jgi:mRNA interferase RelE/StbE
MIYKIHLSNYAIKQLDKLSKAMYLKAYQKMQNLSSNPRPNGCIKLTDSDEYRIRFGDYRILYKMNDIDKTIEVFDIANRKEIYKKK